MSDKPLVNTDVKKNGLQDNKPAAANQPNILPDFEIPYYYEFLLEGAVSKEDKPGVMVALEKHIAAARNFLSYLETVEKENGNTKTIKNDDYQHVQTSLSNPLVEGKIFLKLNQDYNHTTYEVADTKNNKKKMEEEVVKAQSKAEVDKKQFHEAGASLEAKANQLDVTSIAMLNVTDQSLLFHFEKVNKWILDIYYDTPASKYAWDNFKKNIYTSDNGADLKSRIKGLYIPKLYDYQIETCHYINSTRPMFMKKLEDKNFDILLSTSEDIIKAYNARMDYTASKKVISSNKTKILESELDIQQSDKVKKSTEPYINNIYERLIEKENRIRLLNMSDFVYSNANQHMFFRGSGGRISPFLRSDSLLQYGIEEEERKKAKAEGKKEAKKGGEKKEAGKADKQPEKGVLASPGGGVQGNTAMSSPQYQHPPKPIDETFKMNALD